MSRIFDIAQKDLTQILRDRKIFMFLLIMPILFTFMFGFAFGGFYTGEADPRVPLAVIDNDKGVMSAQLVSLLEDSSVVRPVMNEKDQAAYEKDLAKGELAGIVTIPEGYSQALQNGEVPQLLLTADLTNTTGTTVQDEVLAAARRLVESNWTAAYTVQLTEGQAQYNVVLNQALAAWQEPPITIETTTAAVEEQPSGAQMSMAHTAPGMMLQFAIAGLLTAAEVIVSERKSRSLQRLLTTSARHSQILLGHFLAIFTLIFVQFIVLILFGQFALKLDYLREPLATFLLAFSSALMVAALGLLIGELAKSEEQAIIFALVPMFILSAMGGAWVPLEVTGKTFQTVGHVSPVAWALDGFSNILARGQGIESVLIPTAALVGYALLFFFISVWRMNTSEERV